ncbi:glycoside hydrolase family 32 protein [Actinokineospora soli]|uniref:Glycoside hydrolase family 32 protein n=1 Tax=Actinokineospora soli TaxID=1048753 RepID=A0ABW2TP26_9PSEU
MLLSPPASVAGTAPDYAEFPYSHTEYTEPNRGRFHFSPRGGWMNDINAPLYHNGLYHVFFQHYPHGLAWGTMHWGHATSPDLVHWTQKPIALEPGVHPGDLWSGAGVVDSANTAGLRTGTEDPIVLFTGTNGVRIAYSTDGGRTFQSHNGGTPVVTPPGTSRDPKVFWHQPTNRWVMAIWSDNGGNGVEIYTSPDLVQWTWRSRFAAPWFYECPDLFPLALDGDPGQVRWVLADAEGEYVVGSFNGTAFTTDWTAPQRMDQGVTSFDNGTFYAGLTFNHMPDGRVVQMAWQPSNRGSTWTGNATFPAELGLKTFPDGVRVTRWPVAEIAGLRTSTQNWSNATVTPTSDPLAGTTADTYELTATFALGTATSFGLRLHTRPDGTYDKAVTYDRVAQTLNGKPLAPVGGQVSVRVLVDRGQLAVFGNGGRLSLSDNVDFDPAALGLSAFAVGGSVQLVSATLHRLGSAWGAGSRRSSRTSAGRGSRSAGRGPTSPRASAARPPATRSASATASATTSPTAPTCAWCPAPRPGSRSGRTPTPPSTTPRTSTPAAW